MKLLRLAVCAAVPWCAAALAAPGSTPSAADAEHHLKNMSVTLTRERPYRFVLAYHGPTTPFRGLLCYGFAGYNETCTDPHLDWLTPATEIPLYAPGGVPRDLLEGYVMVVRYPSLSPRTFRYALERPSVPQPEDGP